MTFFDKLNRIVSRLKMAFMIIVLSASKPVYGGQAVMDGVMMKGKTSYVTTVNTSRGFRQQVKPFRSLTKKYPILDLPFLRGIIVLFETFGIGYKSLSFSSEVAFEEEDLKNPSSSDSSDDGLFNQILIWGSLAVGILFAIGLFKFLPLLAATGVDALFGVSDMVFNIVDGVVKAFIFVMYMVVIGQLSDIKELFRYHGGEHKSINCFESGEKLTLRNIARHSQEHFRCGTTFLFLVLFVSIIVYLFLPKDLPFALNLLIRLALLPVIAGISYELQRFGALYSKGFGRIVLRPGLWLQSLSVNAPSPKHIRPARASLEKVIENDA